MALLSLPDAWKVSKVTSTSETDIGSFNIRSKPSTSDSYDLTYTPDAGAPLNATLTLARVPDDPDTNLVSFTLDGKAYTGEVKKHDGGKWKMKVKPSGGVVEEGQWVARNPPNGFHRKKRDDCKNT